MKKRLIYLMSSCLLLAFIALSVSMISPLSKERIVLIKTDFGNMKVKLYNETPLHRDNFIKLSNEGFFNGTLFHRIIKDFMIQGGDPDSKTAEPGSMLGNGGPGYTIKAEFNSKFFHKKGVLSAARMGDNVNPEKESSGSQFYIVQGKVYNEMELKNLEIRINQSKKAEILNSLIKNPPKHLKEKVDSIKAIGTGNAFSQLANELNPEIEKELEKEGYFSFSPEQVKIYTTIGGTPHLDGAYTIFGEVIEGLDVLDRISEVKTDRFDRPLEDIKMTVEVIN